jgi:DNA-binding NarL/FixJ family response regulator
VIRVVVADDHPVFRRGLVGVLSEDPDVVVVGEAADGGEAVAVCLEVAPDVVLMDLHMTGTGGVEATRRLTDEQPEVAVLVLSMLDDDESVHAAPGAIWSRALTASTSWAPCAQWRLARWSSERTWRAGSSTFSARAVARPDPDRSRC